MNGESVSLGIPIEIHESRATPPLLSVTQRVGSLTFAVSLLVCRGFSFCFLDQSLGDETIYETRQDNNAFAGNDLIMETAT